MIFTNSKQLDQFSVNLILKALDIKPQAVWFTNDQGKRKQQLQAIDTKGETITFRNLAHKKAYAFDGYVNRFRCFPGI